MEGAEKMKRGQRWSLRHMIALVTGGTKGIGSLSLSVSHFHSVLRVIVEELAGLGASVYTCTLDEGELNQCLHECKAMGLDIHGLVCDLSLRPNRKKLIETVSAHFKLKLNILVNNVGTNISKPTVEYTAEDLSFVMETNFGSAYHMCQLSHPLLEASGVGSIVFISSVCGVVGVDVGTPYAASKGALNQITKNLACDWAKDNICTNSVSPWFVRTQLVKKLLTNREKLESVVA
ncbi:hypothetical protein AMTRI_Chr08g203300 [Amborella trichopoda]